MTRCTACGEDFGGVSAFDAHRVGKHAYDFSEGLRMDPPREDGRRCLDLDEFAEHGLVLNKRGTWSLRRSLEAVQKLKGSAETASEAEA